MSTATELAELDATITENELADDEAERLREEVSAGAPIAEAVAKIIADREANAGAPPEPPTPAREVTDADLKAFERENARHERELAKIMGADFSTFEPCDHCGGVGFAPAGPPAPQPKAHEWFKACDTCNGFGQVLTGSMRAGNEAVDCPTCRGRGYLEKLDGSGQPLAAGNGTAAPIVMPPPATTDGTQAAETAAEGWGVPSWMGNPNLGQ